MKALLAAAALGIGLATPTASFAQAPASPAAAQAVPDTPNNYGDEKNWLCRPGRQDACAVDLTTTIVAADGKLTRETWAADPNAPIDCFYVYPTVSTDTTPYSDMTADPAELGVVRTQAARFASKCRLYAPLYRQVTLAALRRGLGSGSLVPLDRGRGFDDMRDAWRYYLEHDNNGRGFVLIGHSQGSFALMEMIRQDIDGKPIQSRMVSAILLGTTLSVPQGKTVGGTFKSIPLCTSAAQIGCVMTYASFRSTIPPPANTLFGRVTEPGMVAACTNPASLAGGSGTLHAYLSASGGSIIGAAAKPKVWTSPPQAVDTPWVSVPGLLTAKCATNQNATYLDVTINGDPADARTDDIDGDIVVMNQPQANWGLHLIDVNLAVGNFLDILTQQTRTYSQKR